MNRRRRATRLLLVLAVVVLGIEFAAIGVRLAADGGDTDRTTPRYDPPVWAGQTVPGACSGGFYARKGRTVVLTIVGHCATPGATLRDDAGRVIGVFGPRAELPDCPTGRTCTPSDFLALALAPDHIPWGHLDLVDMGAGGYRAIAAGTRPLACPDIHPGDRVEINGRDRFRTGSVLATERYDQGTDTLFPCMVVADIGVAVGDSGGAVLVNGAPAGVVSRSIGGRLGFTSLAEGLDGLGLVLCTSPDCDLSPATAEQPTP